MNIRIVLSLSIALLLSACGGSNNDSAPIPPPGVGTSLNIDATNAKPAIRVAYGATTQTVDTGGLVDDSGLAATPDGGFSKISAANRAPGILDRIMQKDPLPPSTEFCVPSGSITINLDVNLLAFATGMLSTGDKIDVDYADCDQGLGEVVNGRMEFTVVNFTGDLGIGS